MERVVQFLDEVDELTVFVGEAWARSRWILLPAAVLFLLLLASQHLG